MSIFNRVQQVFYPETGNGHGTAKAAESAPNSFLALAIGSIGVVYGDIGTSPLYAFREAVHAATKAGIGLEASVLGVLSLIVWSLLIIVTGKYVLLLLRADNHGEGGTFALMALAQGGHGWATAPLLWLGMVGVSFFLGDAMITPAISVLSAAEGVAHAAPSLHALVLPLAILIIVVLFAVQPFGTAYVARYFGPVMLTWFFALAVGGVLQISRNPSVLQAIAPWHAVGFLISHQLAGFLILGSVFLAVTGAEALYADLGHFGRDPIRFAWFLLVFPALVLNYFGQGALVLREPGSLENPFYNLYPDWSAPVMVVLAVLATIIASQAVITGAFSLARQAVQLNLLPRIAIFHTSAQMRGQIYVPHVNWLLLAAVLLVVTLFKTSANLASAYGVAVAADMIIGSTIAMFALSGLWKWPLQRTALLMAPFLLIELSFFAANINKFLEGAWLPLLVAMVTVICLWSWKVGAKLMLEAARRGSVRLDQFAAQMAEKAQTLVPGTAVFFTPDADMAPLALLHNIKHNHVMHEQNYIISFQTEDRPFVSPLDRVEIEPLNPNLTRIIARYGFMQSPHVPRLLPLIRNKNIEIDLSTASFFVSKRSVYTTQETKLPVWQRLVFVWLHRRAQSAGAYYRIPRDRMIEIGTQLAI